MQFPLQTCQAPNSLRRCTLRARGSSCKGDRRYLSSPVTVLIPLDWRHKGRWGGRGELWRWDGKDCSFCSSWSYELNDNNLKYEINVQDYSVQLESTNLTIPWKEWLTYISIEFVAVEWYVQPEFMDLTITTCKVETCIYFAFNCKSLRQWDVQNFLYIQFNTTLSEEKTGRK